MRNVIIAIELREPIPRKEERLKGRGSLFGRREDRFVLLTARSLVS